MTAFRKLAISLPVDAAERVRRAVQRGQAPSVSAYIAAAIEEKVKLDDLGALLDELLAATGGPLSRAEERAADRLLGVAPTRAGARKPRR